MWTDVSIRELLQHPFMRMRTAPGSQQVLLAADKGKAAKRTDVNMRELLQHPYGSGMDHSRCFFGLWCYNPMQQDSF